MFLNYVNSDDILGQINVNRLIYRTSTLLYEESGYDNFRIPTKMTG